VNLQIQNTCSLAVDVMLFYIFAIKLVLVLIFTFDLYKQPRFGTFQ